MFKLLTAFSGFSVSDLSKSKAFYEEILGLEVEQNEMGLKLHLPGGASIFVYQKENHQPATFTILNLVVPNIDDSINELEGRGVTFEHYDMGELQQDEKGVLRGLAANMGPDIAWFKDPSQNILALLQEE